jgi:hypothetical protein
MFFDLGDIIVPAFEGVDLCLKVVQALRIGRITHGQGTPFGLRRN